MPSPTGQRNLSTPVLFASHGTPLAFCVESESTDWWQKFGKACLAYDVKGIVYICSHWTELDDRIRVGTKAKPEVLQMDVVPREKWEHYPINVSPALGRSVVSLLRGAGFLDAEEDPGAAWHDDNLTPSRWLFPEGTPPATSVSLNTRYDPIFHVKIGEALRPLRKENVLGIGSGSIVHNLFRAAWLPFLLSGGRNTALPSYKPERWALSFERAVRDTIEFNSAMLPLYYSLPCHVRGKINAC
ncbi:Extradiol ring-cleavage dioxygenase, class III enzyme, subunit B [Durotheca rogersii]|uniref:Extradiol ring-cleavage dioxygenase, class III enzyme, subunit B n=1 Tax=Durotheca rogersii TaxID=419775 RepID=UPI00221FBA8D|nr:Extradiol ring-cleavage dioxygenase, class III enzyme, subunit B [Durotheca rogersii]KAI5859645.1 Extradiol ring-cleavage dioxygenase, class III enzyme, subunit B [Durotheca rogersii]